MRDEDRKRAAQAALEIPYFNQLWDEMERAATEACIFAQHDDHEGRQAHAAEARAIRRVRQRLESIANGQSDVGRKAPA